MHLVEIDGSVGEGGGQILRSSLALAAVTTKAVRLTHIRAGRKRPGLMRQHLTAVRAVAAVCDAELTGDALESQTLTFVPRAVRGGAFHFAVGTAGSTSLVLQTVLPPLLRAPTRSELVLEGGTHNPMAPPFDFLAETFFPLLARMGARVEARLVRHGFYPAGGGRIEVTIEPTQDLRPLELLERGETHDLSARVLLANLPEAIAAKEAERLRGMLSLPAERCTIEQIHDGLGPGNAVLVRVATDSHAEIFCGFGEKGVSVGQVIGKLVTSVKKYLEATGPVGVHLADQLVIPLAMAGGGAFRTVGISSHTETNIDVVRRFLAIDIATEREARGSTLVTFRPKTTRRQAYPIG